MKKISIILLLLLCGTSAHAQIKKINLLLLKQNKEIDSLMKVVIKKSVSTELCFSFTTIHTPYGYAFMVLRLGKKQSNVYYRALQPYNIQDIGYFMFDGFTIFVSGDDNASEYFKKTSVSKTFRTISLKDTVYWFSPDSAFKDDPEHNGGFFYFTGRNFRDKGKLITPKN